MSTTSQTSTVDYADRDAVIDHILKANKRAARIDVPGYTWTETKAEPREVKTWDYSLGAWKVIGYIPQVTFTVNGETPKIDGWEFVGTLEWDDVSGECVVRAVPGLGELNLGDHRPRAQFCDHCQSARYRKATFLLRNVHGVFTQVGSTCIQDFLGVKVNPHLVGFNPYEGCDSSNRYTPERVVIEQVFTDGLAIIRSLGWVSAGVARDQFKVATRQRLYDAWFDRTPSDHRGKSSGDIAREAIEAGVREGDAELAAEILRWVREDLTGSSDYVENLRAAVSASQVLPVRNYNPLTHEWVETGETYVSNTCRVDNVGIVVSAISVYQRHIERQATQAAERAHQGSSVHVGAEKERLRSVTGTVTTVRYISNDFGGSTLVIFRTDEGNVFKTFSASDAFGDIEVGQRISVDGTVKKHETYNGIASTVLTRCTLKEVVSA